MKRNTNHLKPIVALILCISVIFSSITAAFAEDMDDDYTENSWYEQQIEHMREITEYNSEGTTVVGKMNVRDLSEDVEKNYQITVRGLNQENKEDVMYQYYQKGVHSGDISGIYQSPVENESLIDAEKFSTRYYVQVPNPDYDDEDNQYNYFLKDEPGPYDSFLCWAGTASNMLWISGYAQETVNPKTNEKFKNEDEVFDYFRENQRTKYKNVPRKDYFHQPGDIGGDVKTAISEFIENLYPAEESRKAEIKNEVKEYNLENNPQGIKDLDSLLVDHSVGLTILWMFSNNTLRKSAYNLDQYNSHAVTCVGVITNPNADSYKEKYVGIILSDSDNDPVFPSARNPHDKEIFGEDDNGNLYYSYDERSELASKQPNTYSAYPLELKEYGDAGWWWTIVGYVDDFCQAVIGAFTSLIDSNKIGAEKPNPPSDTGSGTNNQGGGTGNGTNDQGGGTGSGANDQGGGTGSGTNDQGGGTGSGTNDQGGGTGSGSNGQDGGTILPPSPSKEPIVIEESTWTEEENATNYNQPETAHVIQDGIDYTAIKEFMTREDWLLYSPKNWKYSSSKDTTFRVYVRTSITSLSEIQLDNALLGEEDFETTECMDGLFLLVLNEQKMKSLSEGEHDLRILLNGYEQQTRTITVK